jgi:glutamine cyclotransferase
MATLSCACHGRRKTARAVAQTSATVPREYTYTVRNVYPHDPTSYTQGLYWHDGRLWESTGVYGESRLMEVELETGRALRSVDVGDDYFAEGIALLGGRIYLLTWEDGVAMAYDPATMEVVRRYELQGQGWGLTTDGRQLWMSDGSSRLTVVDTAGFRRVRTVNVRAQRGGGVRQLNELEWIDGRIWANIWLSDRIAIIDPATGTVEATVDLSGLLPESDRTPDTDVLNGIAYDPDGRRIFVTGKYWPKLFEIEISDK